MKRIYLCLAALLILLLMAACESGGKFRVVNQTSHPLYVNVENGPEVTVPGGAEHTFSIATQKQHIFNPDVEKEVPVRLVGETYQIYDEDAEAFTDTTTVTIKAGETLSAYINPNRASFKVVNNSSRAATRIELYKHNFVAAYLIADLGNLAPGQSKFLRVDYATAHNNFYYYAVVTMDDETELTFGNPTTVLDKDEQFLVTLTDPE